MCSTARVRQNNGGEEVLDAAEAVEFLRLSRLDDSILFRVWELCESSEQGYLDESSFYQALKLVALAQAGAPVDNESLVRRTEPVDLVCVARVTEALRTSVHMHIVVAELYLAGPLPGTFAPVGELVRLILLCQNLQGEMTAELLDGIIKMAAAAAAAIETKESAKKAATAAALSQTTSAKVVGAPVTDEWAMSMEAFIKYAGVFDSLGPKKGKLSGKKAKNVLIKSQLPVDALTRIWEVSDVDQDGELNQHEFAIAMHIVSRCLEGQDPPAELPESLREPPSAPAPVPAADPADPPSPAKAPKPLPKFSNAAVRAPEPAAQGWAVPADMKEKYDMIFTAADKDNDGYVEGGDINKIFTRSKLDRKVLSLIWELSDTEHTGRLNHEQFALAMHLISIGVKGETIPTELPPELIPPSSRGTADGGALGASTETRVPGPPTPQKDETPALASAVPAPARLPGSTQASTTASTQQALQQQRTTNESLEAELAAQSDEISNASAELDEIKAETLVLKKKEGQLRAKIKEGKTQLQEILAAIRSAKSSQVRVQEKVGKLERVEQKTAAGLAQQREKNAHLLADDMNDGVAAAEQAMSSGMSFQDYFGDQ